MPSQKNSAEINRELFLSNRSLLLEFLEIYSIPGTEDVIRMHSGHGGVHSSLFFDDKEYFYVPYSLENLEVRGDGSLSRPTIKIINFSGLVSKYIVDKNDFLRAKVKRIRTFIKFIDEKNFLNYQKDKKYWDAMGINPDPQAKLRDDIWIINHKIQENKFFAEFELSNALDMENVTLPKRKVINNYCYWKYRGKNCGYTGNPKADSNNVKFKDLIQNKGEWQLGQSYSPNDAVYLETEEGNGIRHVVYVCAIDHTSDANNKPSISSTHWVRDECSKNLKGCMLRFGNDGDLPFGGFPSSRLY